MTEPRKHHPDGPCGQDDCLWCAMTKVIVAPGTEGTDGRASSGVVSGAKLIEWLDAIAAMTGQILGGVNSDDATRLMTMFAAKIGIAERYSREKNMQDPLWRMHLGIDKENRA